MNILITSAGQRVSLVRAFQKELKIFFPEAKVFAADMCPELSPACHIADQYFEVKKVTAIEYIDGLLQLCIANDIKMVVPTIDTELLVLSKNKQLFEKEGIHVIISSFSLVDKCRDKRKTTAFFQECGIEVPAAIDKNNPTFPLFIKPYNGSLSAETYLITSPDDLKDYHLQNERFLFMEYINKNNHDEYTVDMYFDRKHNVKCIVPRLRLFVRAGEVNKGITSKNVLVPYLKEKLSTIKGAVGCLTVQFFLNKVTERIVAIEINPRFGGGYPLSYCAGANYPQWLIREYFLNEKINYTEDWENGLLMLRYDDEIIVHASNG
ncbi:ATP-grasp domain-containing protein [Ilyomonas limi]|uniref:ATP-grasp domain-containing protein n=1 Tax=Ilyomonas limi TaxID=2575867 RepID=A0A4U3KTG8_9BACT|nr:ATP-grasp domain-containing protein [Ilyomonas limi]TKK65019.1 ATP-grasp domain-containing protein [Ilyomonas limi]